MGLGKQVYGAAGVALGIIGLVWGDFATVWQPVPPEAPAHAVLAYAAALVCIAAGAAMWTRLPRAVAGGALVLASLYAVYSLLWAWRVVQFPAIFGTWLGTAEELALVIGGTVAAIDALPGEVPIGRVQAGRLAFGLCLLVFGAAHIVYVKETAAMVPQWLPPRQDFWAYATGLGDILAGGALLSGIASLLAARLVTLMFAGFGLLVWAPKLTGPPDHIAWAGTAVTFALAGAGWIVADSVARCRRVHHLT